MFTTNLFVQLLHADKIQRLQPEDKKAIMEFDIIRTVSFTALNKINLFYSIYKLLLRMQDQTPKYICKAHKFEFLKNTIVSLTKIYKFLFTHIYS